MTKRYKRGNPEAVNQRRADNTMTKRYQRGNQEGTNQRRADNTMTKRKKDNLLVIVLSVLLSFGHCIVCPSVFWSLYCLSFFLLVDNTMTKRQKDRQYNDQKKEGQTIQ
jgi:hypothetical protein